MHLYNHLSNCTKRNIIACKQGAVLLNEHHGEPLSLFQNSSCHKINNKEAKFDKTVHVYTMYMYICGMFLKELCTGFTRLNLPVKPSFSEICHFVYALVRSCQLLAVIQNLTTLADSVSQYLYMYRLKLTVYKMTVQTNFLKEKCSSDITFH